MLGSLRHHLITLARRAAYSRSGEPYDLDGRTLRYVPGTRPVRARYLRSSDANARYDALQAELFRTQLHEGDTAIDVGAYVGSYTILMAARCGHTGAVIAFEPDPYARRTLLRNIQLNPTVKPARVEAVACSDSVGETMLYSRGGNSQSSLVRSAVEFLPSHHAQEIRVSTTTLDSWMGAAVLAPPRWVKIDAEGAEIRILAGARRLLAGNAGIVCELHPYAWPEFGNTLKQLKALAADSGRRIRYLDESSEIGEDARYGTVLLERHR